MRKRTARSEWEAYLPCLPDHVLADESQRRVVQSIFFGGMVAGLRVLEQDRCSERSQEILDEIAQIMGFPPDSG